MHRQAGPDHIDRHVRRFRAGPSGPRRPAATARRDATTAGSGVLGVDGMAHVPSQSTRTSGALWSDPACGHARAARPDNPPACCPSPTIRQDGVMDRQQEFVLRTVEERDIRFIRLWFTDVLGFLKSVAIAPAELEAAFSEGIGFDGSSIEGLTRVYEADMIARPDPTTFQILPWRGERHGTARMFCDIL